VAVIVNNSSATYGWPAGIDTRFAGEGWSTATALASDHDALERAITAAEPGKPHAVVALVEE